MTVRPALSVGQGEGHYHFYEISVAAIKSHQARGHISDWPDQGAQYDAVVLFRCMQSAECIFQPFSGGT